MNNDLSLENLTNQLKLSDLNFDCQFLILEKLGFADLVNMLKADLLPFAVIEVFRHKFVKTEFIIKKSNQDQSPISMTYSKGIVVNHHDLALFVLDHFGPFMSSLGFIEMVANTDSGRKRQWHEIVSLANEKCDTVTEVYLENMASDEIFAGIKKPFENVMKISLKGNFGKIGNDQFNLNKMFPNMSKLTLDEFKIPADDDSIDLYLPHLISLDVNFYHQFGINEESINNLILKNSQIRDIYLRSANSSFINFLSKQLPNLESLSILSMLFLDFTADIHFKSVKTFRFGVFYGSHKQITFDKLEKFRCDSNKFPWMEFMTKHPTLTTVTLLNILTNDQIGLIPQAAPSLIEAAFITKDVFYVDSIVTFLDESKYLKRFHIFTRSFTVGIDVHELISRTTGEWNVYKNDLHYFIERGNMERSSLDGIWDGYFH